VKIRKTLLSIASRSSLLKWKVHKKERTGKTYMYSLASASKSGAKRSKEGDLDRHRKKKNVVHHNGRKRKRMKKKQRAII